MRTQTTPNRIVERHLAAVRSKRLERGDEVRNTLTGERFEYRGLDRSRLYGTTVLLETEGEIVKMDEAEFRRNFIAVL